MPMSVYHDRSFDARVSITQMPIRDIGKDTDRPAGSKLLSDHSPLPSIEWAGDLTDALMYIWANVSLSLSAAFD
jgi:hypothetical protein